MAKMNKILLRAESTVDSDVPLSDRLAILVSKSGNASLKIDEMAWVCAA